MTAGESDKTEKHSNATNVAVWIAAALVLYVLAVGPAIRAYDDLPPSVQKALEIVYWPLEWGHRNIPLVREPLNWYVSMWRNDPSGD